MFSWGEDWQQGFRLKKGVSTGDGVHFLNLTFRISDLCAGHRVLAFVKSNGDPFIIRINESPDGKGVKGKLKFVDCKEKIKAVSCGDDSVTFLSEGGKLFCVDATQTPFIPSTPKGFGNILVSQVACGSKHTVVLTKGGQVFTWGQDSRGQLGLGGRKAGAGSPQQVQTLSAIPVVHVAAGGEHSFALSVSGGVFGWGGNHCGQLGLGDTTDRHTPTPVHYLNMKKTVHISCGKDHTAALTKDGGVFTFGYGQHGQLGHNSLQNELRPRVVAELWGAKVIQVACGSHHTLVLTDAQRIYSFGCGDQGQLGHGEESHSSVPLPVQLAQDTANDHKIQNIYAGGNSSFATEHVHEDSNTGPKINETQDSVDNMIVKWISECDPKSQKRIKLEIFGMFSSASCLNQSFLDRRKDQHFQTSPKYSGLHLSLAHRNFGKLLKMDFILEEVEAAVLRLLPSLDKKPVGVEGLRIYLLLTEFLHVIQKRKGLQSSKLAEEIAAAAQRLSPESLQIIVEWWSALSPSVMVRHVEVWKNALSGILMSNQLSRNTVSNLLLILHNMHNANERKKIPEASFCSEINQNFLNMDLQRWRNSSRDGTQVVNDPPLLLLCSSAYLLDLKSKIWVLQTNNNWTQGEHQQPIMPFPWNWGCEPEQFFQLNLRRESLLEETFAQLAAAPPNTMKKPLMVFFDGDTAVSQVYRRDFFHQLFHDNMFLLKTEMFMFNDSKTLAWFPSREPTDELQRKLYVFGLLCGLALYNSVIIQLPFPLALFKKLLNVEPTLEDMMEFNPSVGQALQYILDHEDDDLGMCFTIDWDKTEVKLDPQNPGKPVTSENKKEFVDAYVNYAFNTSVERVYQEFERGFFQVCDRHLLKLFRPEELQGVLVGKDDYDWEKMKRNTAYKWPYNNNHPTILMFWEVFDELSEDHKKKLFLFVTGFKRVPILGMDQILMTVRKCRVQSSSHDQHCPQALTCYSYLDLPSYSTREIMKEKLIEALESKRGFVQQ
ncbi:probable E3 ubiquitin-protein ligase HERC3 [Mugil cephalus]|uniref:probable E3 ubiquitin-protein ligase HERC3 n=1 Tax=Mugil cephalus TaxID=48193 RepID=UPI001FB7D080|nr:probable E3 ubiquitin-protein ligase HERC3 [Mugil cephalus]